MRQHRLACATRCPAGLPPLTWWRCVAAAAQLAPAHALAAPVQDAPAVADEELRPIAHLGPLPGVEALAVVSAAEEHLRQLQGAAPQAARPEPGGSAGWQGAVQSLLARLPLRLDNRLRGLALLNVMTLLMGSNWVVVKDSAESATLTDATVFMALRFVLAAALFAPFLRPGDARITRAGLAVGSLLAGGYVTQALALEGTSASRASLLSMFTVLTVPLIAGLSGQRVRPVVWACGAAALVGTAMLEGGGGSLGPPNAGDAWAVASALFFGAQMYAAERCTRRLPPGSELPLMAASLFAVAALSGGAAAALHASDLPGTAAGLQRLLGDWQQLLPPALGGAGGVGLPAAEAAEAVRTAQQLLYTAAVSTDLVLLVELVALQSVTSTDAALIYSLEPVAGAAMAYVLLGERWGPWGWAGGAVIVAASVATQMLGAVAEDGAGAPAPEEGCAAPAAAPIAARD